MKKKLSVGLVLFLLLILPSQSLYAKESLKAIQVTEQDLRISFPESAYVLQPVVEEDNPYLALIGAKKEQVEEYYADNNIFLHCVAADQSYEIVCTIKENTNEQYLTDLLLCSEEELKLLADKMATAYQDYGYSSISTYSYVAKNESFAVISFIAQDEERKVNCKQYFSLLGDKAYYFTLRVFDEAMVQDADDLMVNVVDSIRFMRKSSGFVYNYSNNQYGINFQMPEGWNEMNFASEHEYLQAQFAHENMLGETFQFYTYDIWRDFDTVKKIMISREELDTTMSTSDLSKVQVYVESFYKDYSTVENKRYGLVYLLYSDEPVLLNHNDVQGKYYQQNYCMIRSGILYVFQYGYYDGNDIHRADIDSLLSSIRLVEPKLLEQDEEAHREMSRFIYTIVAIAVLIIIVFAGIIVLIISRIKKKADSDKIENDKDKKE